MGVVTEATLKSVCAGNLGLTGCVDENVFLVRISVSMPLLVHQDRVE